MGNLNIHQDQIVVGPFAHFYRLRSVRSEVQRQRRVLAVGVQQNCVFRIVLSHQPARPRLHLAYRPWRDNSRRGLLL